jgi:hypothetical protein
METKKVLTLLVGKDDRAWSQGWSVCQGGACPGKRKRQQNEGKNDGE